MPITMLVALLGRRLSEICLLDCAVPDADPGYELFWAAQSSRLTLDHQKTTRLSQFRFLPPTEFRLGHSGDVGEREVRVGEVATHHQEADEVGGAFQ